MQNKKDWTGDSNSIFKTLGASSHTENDREENDFYRTNPIAVKLLLELETFENNIWENACGENHIANVLIEAGYNVKCSDLIKRHDNMQVIDFMNSDIKFDGSIITNPPYNMAAEWVEKSINSVPIGSKVAMFLKLQFLEGKARKKLFIKYPPKTVYVSSSRLLCSKDGNFTDSSAVAYCWYIWENGYQGKTELKWFN